MPLVLTALFVVYIVLGMLYESYVHPITILSTLPSAGVGAVLALMICVFSCAAIPAAAGFAVGATLCAGGAAA